MLPGTCTTFFFDQKLSYSGHTYYKQKCNVFGFSGAKQKLTTECCQNSQKMLDWPLKINGKSAFTSQEGVQLVSDQKEGLLRPHSLQKKIKVFLHLYGDLFYLLFLKA